LLAQIKDLQAFRSGAKVGDVIDEIKQFGDKITEVQGKTNFNAFSKTQLHNKFQELDIKNVVFAGVVTSICIDSSARASFELGYHTTIISNAIAGRSQAENDFYCNDIFPLYATVKMTDAMIKEIGSAE
jgi:nicotinamidase-related amidase